MYLLAPDKLENKEKMLSTCQLKIPDFYKILIVNVKKLVLHSFDTEKYVLHYENLQLYLRLGSKLKDILRVLEFSQWKWLKPHDELNTHTHTHRHTHKQIEAGTK